MAKEIKDYQHRKDLVVEGVPFTMIYKKSTYYYRTSGYNHDFYFFCPIEDEDEVYRLCKIAFPEGKNHVKYDGSLATYAEDHDSVSPLKRGYHDAFIELGCNWQYLVREGNDN